MDRSEPKQHLVAYVLVFGKLNPFSPRHRPRPTYFDQGSRHYLSGNPRRRANVSDRPPVPPERKATPKRGVPQLPSPALVSYTKINCQFVMHLFHRLHSALRCSPPFSPWPPGLAFPTAEVGAKNRGENKRLTPSPIVGKNRNLVSGNPPTRPVATITGEAGRTGAPRSTTLAARRIARSRSGSEGRAFR